MDTVPRTNSCAAMTSGGTGDKQMLARKRCRLYDDADGTACIDQSEVIAVNALEPFVHAQTTISRV